MLVDERGQRVEVERPDGARLRAGEQQRLAFGRIRDDADDGDRGGVDDEAQAAHRGRAAARQPGAEDDDRRPLAARGVHRGQRVGGEDDVPAAVGEPLLEEAGDVGVVVGEQEGRRG